MIRIFSESTNQGQLFLNYPMVEAAIDFACLPDPNYNDNVWKLQDLKFNGYKNFVKKNSIIKKFDDICEDNLWIILRQAFEKMNLLTKGNPNDYELLLNVQSELLKATQTISIISSCLLFVRDYHTANFMKYINR